jgi:exopolysaccharide biosynthesis protein
MAMRGVRMDNAKKRVLKPVMKRLLAFLSFQFIFTCISVPFYVFYGPFEEVKRTVVGASWNTLRHRYIARLFLSDEAIAEIIGGSYATDPTLQGEELEKLKFGNSRDNRIEIFNIDGSDFKGKLMIVHDPKRIIAGYSSLLPECGETVSQIVRNNKGIAGINAGGFMDMGWTGTGGSPMGFIIHNGELVYNQVGDDDVKQETVAFTEEGMLIVGRHSVSRLLELGVKEGVSFGPPLIVNGKPTISKGDGGWGIAPRTAIGQRKTGEVLMLVIDGRTLGSLGATLKEVQDIMLEYGAYNAANLDGGSSTTMFWGGKVINRPSDKLGERAVPTAFIVAGEGGGV